MILYLDGQGRGPGVAAARTQCPFSASSPHWLGAGVQLVCLPESFSFSNSWAGCVCSSVTIGAT